MKTYASVLLCIHSSNALELKRIQMAALEPVRPVERVQTTQILAHDFTLADSCPGEDSVPQSNTRDSLPLDPQLARAGHSFYAAPERPDAAAAEAPLCPPPADEAGLAVVYPICQDAGAGLGPERRAAALTLGAAVLGPPVCCV